MKIDHLKAARRFTRLMDDEFELLGIRFGLDALIGFVPGGGDLVTFMLSLYLIWIGIQMKVPQHQLMRMIINILIDGAIGAVPFLGDIGDVFFKANVKNLKILEEYGANIVEGEVIK